MQLSAEDLAPLEFDTLLPIEIPIKIKDAPDGEYVLRQANGGAQAEYRNTIIRSTRLSQEGKVTSADGLADAAPILVAACVFRIQKSTQDGGRTQYLPVTVEFVRSWPSPVIQSLFNRIKKISDIDPPDTVETLKERIARDQKALQLLLSGKDPAKN